jgi:hypothetical protein
MRTITPIIAAVALVTACAPDITATPTTTTAATTTSAPDPTVTTTGETTTTTPPQDPMPPHTSDELIALLDPIVAPLGFRVTRAALVDMTTYQASPDGGHLAVYVAPLEDMDADEHAGAFVPLAKAFLPSVFDRWSDLDSFDICQEPHIWLGGGTPPAVTIIDLDRETALAIDWSTVDLATLIALSAEHEHLTVTAAPEVAGSPTWLAASAA